MFLLFNLETHFYFRVHGCAVECADGDYVLLHMDTLRHRIDDVCVQP